LEEPNSDVSQSIRKLASRFTGTPGDQYMGEMAEQAPSERKRRGLFRRH
jgi:hypothetical protein